VLTLEEIKKHISIEFNQLTFLK